MNLLKCFVQALKAWRLCWLQLLKVVVISFLLYKLCLPQCLYFELLCSAAHEDFLRVYVASLEATHCLMQCLGSLLAFFF